MLRRDCFINKVLRVCTARSVPTEIGLPPLSCIVVETVYFVFGLASFSKYSLVMGTVKISVLLVPCSTLCSTMTKIMLASP